MQALSPIPKTYENPDSEPLFTQDVTVNHSMDLFTSTQIGHRTPRRSRLCPDQRQGAEDFSVIRKPDGSPLVASPALTRKKVFEKSSPRDTSSPKQSPAGKKSTEAFEDLWTDEDESLLERATQMDLFATPKAPKRRTKPNTPTVSVKVAKVLIPRASSSPRNPKPPNSVNNQSTKPPPSSRAVVASQRAANIQAQPPPRTNGAVARMTPNLSANRKPASKCIIVPSKRAKLTQERNLQIGTGQSQTLQSQSNSARFSCKTISPRLVSATPNIQAAKGSTTTAPANSGKMPSSVPASNSISTMMPPEQKPSFPARNSVKPQFAVKPVFKPSSNTHSQNTTVGVRTSAIKPVSRPAQSSNVAKPQISNTRMAPTAQCPVTKSGAVLNQSPGKTSTKAVSCVIVPARQSQRRDSLCSGGKPPVQFGRTDTDPRPSFTNVPKVPGRTAGVSAGSSTSSVVPGGQKTRVTPAKSTPAKVKNALAKVSSPDVYNTSISDEILAALADPDDFLDSQIEPAAQEDTVGDDGADVKSVNGTAFLSCGVFRKLFFKNKTTRQNDDLSMKSSKIFATQVSKRYALFFFQRVRPFLQPSTRTMNWTHQICWLYWIKLKRVSSFCRANQRLWWKDSSFEFYCGAKDLGLLISLSQTCFLTGLVFFVAQLPPSTDSSRKPLAPSATWSQLQLQKDRANIVTNKTPQVTKQNQKCAPPPKPVGFARSLSSGNITVGKTGSVPGVPPNVRMVSNPVSFGRSLSSGNIGTVPTAAAPGQNRHTLQTFSGTNSKPAPFVKCAPRGTNGVPLRPCNSSAVPRPPGGLPANRVLNDKKNIPAPVFTQLKTPQNAPQLKPPQNAPKPAKIVLMRQTSRPPDPIPSGGTNAPYHPCSSQKYSQEEIEQKRQLALMKKQRLKLSRSKKIARWGWRVQHVWCEGGGSVTRKKSNDWTFLFCKMNGTNAVNCKAKDFSCSEAHAQNCPAARDCFGTCRFRRNGRDELCWQTDSL